MLHKSIEICGRMIYISIYFTKNIAQDLTRYEDMSISIMSFYIIFQILEYNFETSSKNFHNSFIATRQLNINSFEFCMTQKYL
jgi:hypothetical protein